jgi:hypothetical protein
LTCEWSCRKFQIEERKRRRREEEKGGVGPHKKTSENKRTANEKRAHRAMCVESRTREREREKTLRVEKKKNSTRTRSRQYD